LEVKVINNPVDQVFFEKLEPASVREQLGIPSSAFVGISVAAQLDDPSKNIDSAITSFLGGVGANTASRHMILVGQGGKNFAKEYRNVHLVGSGDSTHVARHISAADLLVVTSTAESAGLTIQEAATQRVPAAILSNGGSDEFIVPNESGLIATNSEELSELIDRASKDFVSLRLMGDRAFKRVVQTHRLDKVVGQYLSIYNWVGGSK
jgi:glycosyltransferase involved in cell wall biosynthesis